MTKPILPTALGVALLVACHGGDRPPKEDTSTIVEVPAETGAKGAPAGVASAHNVSSSRTKAAGADAPRAVAAGGEVAHADSLSAITPSGTPDTAAPAASAADLAQLRTELTMPVPGVDPADMPDSFDDPRGAHGERRHQAFDILAPRGTPVVSATSGRLLKLYTSKDGGLMVYAADSTERFILMYAHLDRYADGLTDGMPLRQGQVIGYVGTTGNAPPNTPHLHFAIARSENVTQWWRGTPVDPRPLLLPTGD
jgi:peptidoglycan LD-endopeptidase LytH